MNEPLHISLFKKSFHIHSERAISHLHSSLCISVYLLVKSHFTFTLNLKATCPTIRDMQVNRDMASSRPSKRQRPDDGGSYHETVPFLDDFHAVHAREGRLFRQGPAPPERSLLHASDKAWMTATSWGGPPDDPELALDLTGDWYNEMVDREVMEPTDDNPVALPKKKRSKVSVSDSSNSTPLTH